MTEKTTIVEYFGNGGFQRCGYCKGTSSKISHGIYSINFLCTPIQSWNLFSFYSGGKGSI